MYIRYIYTNAKLERTKSILVSVSLPKWQRRACRTLSRQTELIKLIIRNLGKTMPLICIAEWVTDNKKGCLDGVARRQVHDNKERRKARRKVPNTVSHRRKRVNVRMVGSAFTSIYTHLFICIYVCMYVCS